MTKPVSRDHTADERPHCPGQWGSLSARPAVLSMLPINTQSCGHITLQEISTNASHASGNPAGAKLYTNHGYTCIVLINSLDYMSMMSLWDVHTCYVALSESVTVRSKCLCRFSWPCNHRSSWFIECKIIMKTLSIAFTFHLPVYVRQDWLHKLVVKPMARTCM